MCGKHHNHIYSNERKHSRREIDRGYEQAQMIIQRIISLEKYIHIINTVL